MTAFSVDNCFDGEDAIHYIDMGEFDAVILDIMIPKIDGYDVLKHIRSKNIETPVLFLTAKDSIDGRVKGLDAGADGYLIKPFAFDELLARIFINLISNSYSYGKENGTIEVGLLERDVQISDDGIGISEENIPKIWERFYQVNSSRTNTDGSMGLGLSMVKLIADKLGEGTAFTLVIPKN